MKEMIDKTQLAEEKQEFPAFPYEPYSIQIDFMNALYRFLDKGGVSMLESPTGIYTLISLKKKKRFIWEKSNNLRGL